MSGKTLSAGFFTSLLLRFFLKKERILYTGTAFA